MKRGMIVLYFIVQIFFLDAEIPRNELFIIDKCQDITFELGDRFSKVLDSYSDVVFMGEKKYTNITYKEYGHDGIIFSISVFAEIEKEARILGMKVLSQNYLTKRGITIGSTAEEVLLKYGNPDFVNNNSYYYYNEEYDVLELMFGFNKEGIVNSIELVAGT